MADRWALVVAVDKYLDPALNGVTYAEASARAVADALAGAGWPKANQILLFGQQATKTVLESRLGKLKKAVRRGDDLLVFVTGKGFSRGGAGYLACWDTQADDLTDTAAAVADLFAALNATKAARVTVLLDVGETPLPSNPVPADTLPQLDVDQLHALFDDSARAVCLMACAPDEESYAPAALKKSAWAHLVADALSGRTAKAADAGGRVTARSLHDFVGDELPRTLRKHFGASAVQTPQLYGACPADAILADVSGRVGGAENGFLLDPARLSRVVFRSESSGRVKDLTGFRKSFQMPTSATPSARKFIARLAAEDVKADLDEVFAAVREQVGYKRKDLDVSTGGDGAGTLRTPDFEYTVSAGLDPADPARVTWTREVGQFADPGFVRGPGFEAVFGKLFDQLVFEFAVPVDVSGLVDRLEDRLPKGVKIHVASDGTTCDVALAGFAGRVTVGKDTLTVRGRGADSAGLLDQFLAFLQTVGPLGEPAALPPRKKA
ncbi:caspase family protein [Fimbriiglobus ruber]|uniref:caspase family protein n=1 Tax=Fimbriiglobus ruber TaxID=1908690 RepID=UPI00137B7E2B|nr:caspase family protein [Fimbriiglobus ruber]